VRRRDHSGAARPDQRPLPRIYVQRKRALTTTGRARGPWIWTTSSAPPCRDGCRHCSRKFGRHAKTPGRIRALRAADIESKKHSSRFRSGTAARVHTFRSDDSRRSSSPPLRKIEPMHASPRSQTADST